MKILFTLILALLLVGCGKKSPDGDKGPVLRDQDRAIKACELEVHREDYLRLARRGYALYKNCRMEEKELVELID